MIQDVLSEREKTHGDYLEVSQIAQMLYNDMMASRNGPRLPAFQKEALHMICSKVARLLSGDNLEADHWVDIAGYATLVVNNLERAKDI